jgi:hypothetical protein
MEPKQSSPQSQNLAAWPHTEAVQSMSLPLLLRYILILSSPFPHPKLSPLQFQGCLLNQHFKVENVFNWIRIGSVIYWTAEQLSTSKNDLASGSSIFHPFVCGTLLVTVCNLWSKEALCKLSQLNFLELSMFYFMKTICDPPPQHPSEEPLQNSDWVSHTVYQANRKHGDKIKLHLLGYNTM